MSDPLVTTKHMRAAGICVRGAREYFAQEGLDWRTFVREGLPASVFEATQSAVAMRAVAIARKEADHG